MNEINNYGKYLVKLRESRGLKQSDVASSLGFTKQHISKYETNKNRINYSIISTLAKYYNVDLTSFMEMKDEKNNNICDIKEFNSLNNEYTFQYLRRRSGLAQKEVAKRLNISQARLSKIECGQSYPYLEEFKKFHKLYNISYERMYFNLTKKEEIFLNSNIIEKPINVRKNAH